MTNDTKETLFPITYASAVFFYAWAIISLWVGPDRGLTGDWYLVLGVIPAFSRGDEHRDGPCASPGAPGRRLGKLRPVPLGRVYAVDRVDDFSDWIQAGLRPPIMEP
jgi:hypothetical protein